MQQPKVPILMYHKVAPLHAGSKTPGHYVSPALFNRHMGLLKALKFDSVKLSGLFCDPMPRRPIAITFDDGYQDFFTNALPRMKARDLFGAVFLVSRRLGEANQWDLDAGDVEERLMSVSEILEAKEEGTEFGSHTLDHVNLARVEPDEAWRQIADSRCELEEILKTPINTFCYPYGSKTPEVMRMVEKAGYRLACSTEKGVNDPSTDRYNLKRINVRRDTSAPILAFKLWRGMRYGR